MWPKFGKDGRAQANFGLTLPRLKQKCPKSAELGKVGTHEADVAPTWSKTGRGSGAGATLAQPWGNFGHRRVRRGSPTGGAGKHLPGNFWEALLFATAPADWTENGPHFPAEAAARSPAGLDLPVALRNIAE